jgi:hypothetical protein
MLRDKIERASITAEIKSVAESPSLFNCCDILVPGATTDYRATGAGQLKGLGVEYQLKALGKNLRP